MGYRVIFQVVAIPISSSIVLFYLNIQNPVFQLLSFVVLGIEHGTLHFLGKPSTRVAPRLPPRPPLLPFFFAKAGTQGFVNARQAFLRELHMSLHPLAFSLSLDKIGFLSIAQATLKLLTPCCLPVVRL